MYNDAKEAGNMSEYSRNKQMRASSTGIALANGISQHVGIIQRLGVLILLPLAVLVLLVNYHCEPSLYIWRPITENIPKSFPWFPKSSSISTNANKGHHHSLVPFAFSPLPLGAIKPEGWLRDQMTIMSNGLAGRAADFLDIVKDNHWVGGSRDYSDLHEALPYWFNGIVGIAYGLEDERLKSQVLNVTSIILKNQYDDGWLGLETNYNSNNLWARFPVMLAFMQLADAEPTLRNDIVAAMHGFVPLLSSLLEDGNSPNEVWGRARYADLTIALQWLVSNHPSNNTKLIYDTMSKLESWGIDWENFYTDDRYPKQDLDTLPLSVTEPLFPFVHNVNHAQGLKTNGVNYRHNKKPSLVETVSRSVNWTITYHGSASGSILGDERLAGSSPNRGHEFCGVVEEIYSLSYLHQLFGDPSYADLTERVIFNAMPNMLTEDHWTHQYIGLSNQPWAAPNPEASGLWQNVGDRGTTYGIITHYPCCAVNHHQGYPKFLQAAFSLEGDNGIAQTLLAPAAVKTKTSAGTEVSIDCATTYPFSEHLVYDITASAPFTFQLRVPGWFNGDPMKATTFTPKKFNSTTRMLSFSFPAGRIYLAYRLPRSLYTEPRANNTIAVYSGAVLYALDIGEETSSPGHSDVANAPEEANLKYYNSTSPWNIAIDPKTLVFHSEYENSNMDPSRTLPNPLWAYRAPPSYVTAKGCPIEWDLFHGYPAPVPLSEKRTCIGDAVDIVLRPYGSLRARMTEFPTIDLGLAG